jgi:predicted enzyme related to lactoylglutathione lyase
MTIRFDHIGILSRTGAENAQIGEFFSHVLGLEVSGDAGGGYAEVKAGEMTIALHAGALIDDYRPQGGTLLQCSCDDVREQVEAVRARGGRISLEPVDTNWGTTSAYVSGPHGVLVELYEWRNS